MGSPKERCSRCGAPMTRNGHSPWTCIKNLRQSLADFYSWVHGDTTAHMGPGQPLHDDIQCGQEVCEAVYEIAFRRTLSEDSHVSEWVYDDRIASTLRGIAKAKRQGSVIAMPSGVKPGELEDVAAQAIEYLQEVSAEMLQKWGEQLIDAAHRVEAAEKREKALRDAAQDVWERLRAAVTAWEPLQPSEAEDAMNSLGRILERGEQA